MLAVDANQRWDVGDGDRLDGAPRAVRPVLDRGADQPRRHPRPRRDRPGGRARSASPPASTSTTGSCSSSSSQAEAIERLPDRCLPARRRQRGRRGPAAGRQVRRAGLPARRRRRPVRAGPAPLGVRLHRGERAARRPDDRVRRPPPRALRRSGGRRATAATGCRRRPATARRCGPDRWPDTRFPSRRRAWRARRFGQVIRVRPEAIERVRAAARRAVAGRPRGDRGARTSGTTRSFATGSAVRLLRVRRRRPRGGPGGDGRRPDRPALVDPHRRDAGPLSGARAGSWWLTLPEIFHTD